MARLPTSTERFIAILVQELRVIETSNNVVWKNFYLIHADSPETAYQKALQIGNNLRSEYKNSDDQTVKSLFRGVAELLPIYEELEGGAEILFESEENLSEERILKMVKYKEELAAFSPSEDSDIAPSLG